MKAALPFRRTILSGLAMLCAGGTAHAQTPTVSVQIRLRTGGEVTGLIVDHDDHGIVIVRDKMPYVFAWREMELASALAARRAALVLLRGGEDQLTGEDWFAMGLMALRWDRNDVAGGQFREAEKRDKQLKARVREALEEYRRRKQARAAEDPFEDAVNDERENQASEWADAVPERPADIEAQLSDAYHTFGAKVQEVLGKDVVLLESEHFLVWTDWEGKLRDQLPRLCESMYAALSEQFGIAPDEQVFAAKCPVFCFRSKAKFRKFARYFDGYEAVSATGYTRSIERHGHVHVVLLRPGKSEIDFDQFACTLVHEGSHAFVHRLYTHRLIPHWVNEGLAELMAERVLGERCDVGETADLLARQYARYDWKLDGLLQSASPLEVHQYPAAHSIVAYLQSRDRAKFVEFVRRLKDGRSSSEALADAYGLSIEELDRGWREASTLGAPKELP